MNIDKINNIEERIKGNKEKLKYEKGNSKNQQILRLKIKIDELQIRIERLKD
jgi:hypothetical protein